MAHEPIDGRDAPRYSKGSVPDDWYPDPEDAADPINKGVAENDDEKE
jgi:hypothetical protein